VRDGGELPVVSRSDDVEASRTSAPERDHGRIVDGWRGRGNRLTVDSPAISDYRRNRSSVSGQHAVAGCECNRACVVDPERADGSKSGGDGSQWSAVTDKDLAPVWIAIYKCHLPFAVDCWRNRDSRGGDPCEDIRSGFAISCKRENKRHEEKPHCCRRFHGEPSEVSAYVNTKNGHYDLPAGPRGGVPELQSATPGNPTKSRPPPMYPFCSRSVSEKLDRPG